MRSWGFLPSPQELEAFTAPLEAFREKWSSINAPFPAFFDGQLVDVRALDYVNYEGIDFPGASVEARRDGLRRSHSPRGWPGVGDQLSRLGSSLRTRKAYPPSRSAPWLVCTSSNAAGPQFGKHLWLVQQAAFECLLICDRGQEPSIRALLDGNAEYLERVDKTLEALRNPHPHVPPTPYPRRRGPE